MTVIVQNSDPFTYFRQRPMRVGRAAPASTPARSRSRCSAGDAARAADADPAAVLGKPETVLSHRQVESLPDLDGCGSRRSTTGRSRVQVDGDYIGEYEEVEYAAVPRRR